MRETPDPSSAVLGEIVPSYEAGAIRLLFIDSDGQSFHTSRFRRFDSATTRILELTSAPETAANLPGIYRAELRDSADKPVGWFRVRILPFEGMPRSYAAEIPKDLNGAIAAAAIELVDSDIDRIVAASEAASSRS